MEGRNGRLPHSGNDLGFGVKDGGDIEYRRESKVAQGLSYWAEFDVHQHGQH